MEKRNLKISFYKSGRGTLSTRVILPIKWIKKMGITEENREITAYFDEISSEIKIKKIEMNVIQ